MSTISVHLSLSGRPLAEQRIHLEGRDEPLWTDSHGHLTLDLQAGPTHGEVWVRGQRLPFELVNAPGVRRLRVDLRAPERPIEDAAVLAAMPADRYLPIGLLGSGKAGRVYKCRDTALDRLVAVKILSEDFAADPENQEKFLAEARQLARVDHPNLIQVHDVGIHQNRAFIVVHYVDGPNLDELLAAEKELALDAVAAAGVQLAQGLAIVHEAGLVHRDVKPSNGLVDKHGVVRLADFGLVRPLVEVLDPQSRVFGTPLFMSPEQIQGQPLGPASDIYSLGASLYKLVSGQPPFPEGDLLFAHLFDPPRDLRDHRRDAPAELANCIAAMLAKAPEDRPDTGRVVEWLLPLAATTRRKGESPYLPRLSARVFGATWAALESPERTEVAEPPRTAGTEPAPPAAGPVPEDDEAEDWVGAETQEVERPVVGRETSPRPVGPPSRRPSETETNGSAEPTPSDTGDDSLGSPGEPLGQWAPPPVPAAPEPAPVPAAPEPAPVPAAPEPASPWTGTPNWVEGKSGPRWPAATPAKGLAPARRARPRLGPRARALLVGALAGFALTMTILALTTG